MKSIRITCQGAAVAPHDLLEPFQGKLKDLSTENYEKLRAQIFLDGFSEPISVWRDPAGKLQILNGHQRHRVVGMMIKDGFECPPLPINFIEAKDAKEAKRKVLALTSNFGEMTNEGLYEFITSSDIDPAALDEFRFAEIDVDQFKRQFFTDPVVDEEGAGEDEKPKLKKPIECPHCKKEFIPD